MIDFYYELIPDMFTFKEITNKKTWDSFIDKIAPHSFFQYWNWGEVEKKAGKKLWRFGITEDQTRKRSNDQKNKLLGISQIVKVSARRGTFLHVRHGPIFKELNDTIVAAWIQFIANLARKENAWFIRVSPLVAIESAQLWRSFGFRPAAIHRMDAEVVSIIDTTQSLDEILGHMRKTTRYLIKKAEKIGVVVEKSPDIDAFLALYAETSKRHRFVPHSAIKTEFELLSKEGQEELLLASYEGKVLAGAIIAYVGNQGIYRHGASISSVIPVAYLLQWRAIQETKRRGLPHYNLWGIADTSNTKHPWHGLTLFKEGFGGTKKEYLHAHDLSITPLYYISRAIEEARRRLRGY